MKEDEKEVPVPESWLNRPLSSLVVGDNSYAKALGVVFGCEFLSPTNLLAKPAEIPGRGYPRVLGGLERVFVVAGSAHGPAEMIRWHGAMWEWVARLSPNSDQHDLKVVFVIPNSGEGAFVQSLLTGLALAGLEPEAHGHGIFHMSDGLTSLLTSIGNIRPMDLVGLRSRQRSDTRHAVVARLRNALLQPDQVAAREAAKALAGAFQGEEYNLDLFCRPPAHGNGNALRRWLAGIVTGRVTPEQWQDQRSVVAGWLDIPQNNLNS